MARAMASSKVINDLRVVVVRIDTTVADMHHKLFGNGQPGELDKLHGRVSAVSDRVDSLENFKWKLVGISVGATTLASLLSFLIGLYLQLRK